jgi:tRNA modification GTPase
VIRLSGPGTLDLCTTLFQCVPQAGNTVAATRFLLADGLPLPCLLIRYDGPRSYTGEDAAEILVPGNPSLLERVMARLIAQPGVREAQPGEFSARAYLNGRMTIEQAEGVAALIAAGTEDQLSAAALLMNGRTGERYRVWADEAATLLALVEAGIDFTDQEDVVPIPPRELARRIGTLAAVIRAHLGTKAGAEQDPLAPRVVLVGPPNAGKSTLFNALLGRRRAIVSPLAGTTRDAIAEDMDLSRDVPCGPLVTLVDLAGLDESFAQMGGEIDRQTQRQAHSEIRRASVLVLCDPNGRFEGPNPSTPGTPSIRVRTKSDVPHTRSSAPRDDAIGVCALDGRNLGVLRRAIADAAWGSPDARGAWLMPRHRRALAAACDRLESTLAAVAPDARSLASPELVAGELRGAVDHLGELVGDISPDDIIGRVFATFCIGK